MKEIRTIKMVESVEVQFVANDGTVFEGDNAEMKCINYERTCDVNKVKERFKRLESKVLNTSYIEWFYPDGRFRKILLNSKSDYIAMMDYYNVVIQVCDNDLNEPASYPYSMIVAEYFDYVTEYIGDLASELQKTIDQLNE